MSQKKATAKGGQKGRAGGGEKKVKGAAKRTPPDALGHGPEPEDKTSDAWRYWKLRQFESAVENRMEDHEAYNRAWDEFRALASDVLADEDFNIVHAKMLMPHLVAALQHVDLLARGETPERREAHKHSTDEQGAGAFARTLLDFWNGSDAPDWFNDALVDAVSEMAELFGLPNPFGETDTKKQAALLARVIERAGPTFTLRRAQPPVTLDTFKDADISALIHVFLDFAQTRDCAALLVLLQAFTYTDDMYDRENMLSAAHRLLLPYLAGADELINRTIKHVLFSLRAGAQEGGGAA